MAYLEDPKGNESMISFYSFLIPIVSDLLHNLAIMLVRLALIGLFRVNRVYSVSGKIHHGTSRECPSISFAIQFIFPDVSASSLKN